MRFYEIMNSNRNTLDEDAYEELMQLTREDLQEFNASLQRMISGDTTLIDELGAVQLVRYKNALIQIIVQVHIKEYMFNSVQTRQPKQ